MSLRRTFAAKSKGNQEDHISAAVCFGSTTGTSSRFMGPLATQALSEAGKSELVRRRLPRITAGKRGERIVLLVTLLEQGRQGGLKLRKLGLLSSQIRAGSDPFVLLVLKDL
jgi:hypothetical protein